MNVVYLQERDDQSFNASSLQNPIFSRDQTPRKITGILRKGPTFEKAVSG